MANCMSFRSFLITTGVTTICSYFYPGKSELEASFASQYDFVPTQAVTDIANNALVTLSPVIMNQIEAASTIDYTIYKLITWRDKMMLPITAIFDAALGIIHEAAPKARSLAGSLGDTITRSGEILEETTEVIDELKNMTSATAKTLNIVAVPLIIIMAISVSYWIASKSGLIKRVRSDATHAYKKHVAPRVQRLFDDEDDQIVQVNRSDLNKLVSMAKSGPQSQRQPPVQQRMKNAEDRRVFAPQQLNPDVLKKILAGG